MRSDHRQADEIEKPKKKRWTAPTLKRAAVSDVTALTVTLDFTIARLEVVNEHMRAGNQYAAGEAFGELRAALRRQRAALQPKA